MVGTGQLRSHNDPYTPHPTPYPIPIAHSPYTASTTPYPIPIATSVYLDIDRRVAVRATVDEVTQRAQRRLVPGATMAAREYEGHGVHERRSDVTVDGEALNGTMLVEERHQCLYDRISCVAAALGHITVQGWM